MAEETVGPALADLAALARAGTGGTGRQLAWTHTSADLNVNLLVFDGSGGVAEHVNDEVDVLLVGIAGVGTIRVEGTPHTLAAGGVIVVPKGLRRAVEATGGRFAYLTCHRRRAGLWPRGVARPGAGPGAGPGDRGGDAR